MQTINARDNLESASNTESDILMHDPTRRTRNNDDDECDDDADEPSGGGTL